MIIVTGGAGFIGSNFVRDWLEANGEPVLVLDKLTYAGNLDSLVELKGDSRFRFERVDICDGESLASILTSHQPRAVIHFAAESHVDRSIHGPAEFVETNIHGTFQLLEAVRSYRDTLNAERQAALRFIHVSTDEVYGSLGTSDAAFVETSQYAPNSPYAASKAASDHLVRAYYHTYAVPVITTNCSNNYGPYQFPEKLIPLVILNALEGRPIPIYGDGGNVRDWLYVGDHCRAIRSVLKGGRLGETYNIGGDCERRNIDVVKLVCAILDDLRPKENGHYEDQVQFVADRAGHDRRYAVDSTKIKMELDWSSVENFDSGVRRTVNWYLQNAVWANRVRDGRYRQWVDVQYGQLVAA